MKILAIESSCDETSVAIVEDGRKVHTNIISSQIASHSKTGGVVPEVAARKHAEMIIPVLKKAFEESKMSWDEIDAIAVTKKPGLRGSVVIGRAAAKALAFAKDKTLLEVNHIHGHMYSTLLDLPENEEINFPVLVLTVSGGHNDLWLMKSHNNFKLLGSTKDDAAGEAFDKVARLLGLGYPGGPAIEKRARDGSEKAVNFPVASMPDYNFSFSGLKTSVLYYLKKNEEKLKDANFVNDVAASFQKALVDALLSKLKKAVFEFNPSEIHLVGGCSANQYLRKRIKDVLPENSVFRSPEKMSYCTDNAAMIAVAGYFKNLQF